MTQVVATVRFQRAFRRLPPDRQRRALRAIELFQNNRLHPGLDFERRKGVAGCWTIRCDRNFRIVLRETEDRDSFELADVGSHDTIDRDW